MSIFNSVPISKIKRSSHNLSHQTKASFDAGPIYPILTELAYPGDSWFVSLEQFIRTMPLTAPVMDMMDVKVDAFFVPLRLIWDDFEDFVTLGMNGEFSATWPTITVDINGPGETALKSYLKLCGVGGLADYLNFSTNSVPTVNNSFYRQYDALPFRAYQLIYNEYFLNENLDSPIPIDTSSGDLELAYSVDPSFSSFVGHFNLKNRGWRKDYFTSALPAPQKGPAVRIPSSDVDISLTDNGPMYFKPGENDPFPDDTIGTGNMVGEVTSSHSHINDHAQLRVISPDESDYFPMYYDSGIKGTASYITPPTIEELRYAETLQEFYEAQARGGSRPKEYYLNIWNTRSKDSRLDRPEYLGGYRGPITISDVDQTSQSATTAQGTLAGKGVSAGGNKLFKYHTSEFGIIMVVMSVVPKSAYFQGDRRWNLYRDVFDIPCPYFANLGEQEIYNGEIFYQGTDDDKGTFGYTPRYAEGKFIPDSVHGQCRSSLLYWHLARKFESLPNLNSNFVHMFPEEISRIFPSQVSNNDKFIGTFFFHVKRNMGLPYYGVPRLIHSI